MPNPIIDAVHLPPDIEAGANLGPTFSTSVVQLSGGAEQRNQNWDQERFAANIAYGVMAKDNAQDVEDGWRRIVEFFRARRGRARGFLFRDWTDYEAVDEPLYPARSDTASEYQLTKRYGDYLRRITRPSVMSLQLYVGNDRTPYPQAGFADLPAWNTPGKGLIVFARDLPAGAQVYASFEFDIPVRFDVDDMKVSLFSTEAGSIPSIDVIQVYE